MSPDARVGGSSETGSLGLHTDLIEWTSVYLLGNMSPMMWACGGVWRLAFGVWKFRVRDGQGHASAPPLFHNPRG